MAVLGRTGSGKSMFVKAVTSRMLDEQTDIFIFDSIARKEYSVGPDGKEETSYASLIGADIIRFEKGAGLDPFAVFETKRQAGDFIADLCEIKDMNTKVSLLDLANNSVSVQDLLNKADGDLKKILRVNLEPYMYLFNSKTEISSRMVFVLDEIHDAKARDAAAFLALAAIWKTIKTLPISEKKIIVIDEGWAFVETNPRTGSPYFTLASTYIPEITRTGRHYNTAVFFATQQISDVMSGPGRDIFENCATKAIFKEDVISADLLEKSVGLSEREKSELIGARPGFGMLVIPEGHIPMYNIVSRTEMSIFTTAPKEMKS